MLRPQITYLNTKTGELTHEPVPLTENEKELLRQSAEEFEKAKHEFQQYKIYRIRKICRVRELYGSAARRSESL